MKTKFICIFGFMLKCKIGMVILILIRGVFDSCAQENGIQEPALAREIISMRDEDQKMRIKWAGWMRKGKSETPKFKELTKKLIAKDRANTARMRGIVAQYGWPTYELVGQRASNSAWLLVQHADRNPLFQIKCLPFLKEAVDEGQANPSNYAYLYDRVQVAKGEMQLYATQSSSNNGLTKGEFYAIEDESNVQKRREEMNIQQHVEDYARSMGFTYTIPTKEQALERLKGARKDYEENLRIAREAIEGKDYDAAADAYLKVAMAFGHVTSEDFVNAARTLSLAKHPEARMGISFLMKAMARGWEGIDEVNDDSDFLYLQEASPEAWQDFLITLSDRSIDL